MVEGCKGCVCLVEEEWPRGMKVCRCMNVLRGTWFGRVVGNPYPADVDTPRIQRPAWCDGKEEEMEKYLEKAIAKIEEEYKSGKYDRYANAMKAEVKKALLSFVSQDEELAQAVVQGGSFDECMKAVATNCGSHISDLTAFERAVQFYFPGARVRYQMSVDLIGDAGESGPSGRPVPTAGGASPSPTQEVRKQAAKILDLSDFL